MKVSECVVSGLGRRAGDSDRRGGDDLLAGLGFELGNRAGEKEGVTNGDTGARTGCLLPWGS